MRPCTVPRQAQGIITSGSTMCASILIKRTFGVFAKARATRHDRSRPSKKDANKAMGLVRGRAPKHIASSYSRMPSEHTNREAARSATWRRARWWCHTNSPPEVPRLRRHATADSLHERDCSLRDILSRLAMNGQLQRVTGWTCDPDNRKVAARRDIPQVCQHHHRDLASPSRSAP